MNAHEAIVQFGTAAPLTGVLTEPAMPVTDRPVAPVILINSGILHKVGASRLYVRLARALAGAGVPVLRFDLSGLGDSGVRRDALAFDESSVAETREAMDHLQQIRGWRHFQLAGLCSGADVAHMTALVDRRVVSMASVDARTHETPRYWVKHYAPKLMDTSAWSRRLRQVIADEETSAPASPEHDERFELPTYVRVIPPREQLAHELATIVERGTRLLYVFTDGLDNYNYEGQHRDAFHDVPFGNHMTECHLRGADHILSDRAAQDRAIAMHLEWATAPIPAQALATAR
jgi:pimeloyl-ACP methyl ester carboxylesterase